MARDLCIVGVNHRTAPVALRERLAFPASSLAAALGDLKTVPGVHEAAIVSTCNRVEIVTGTSLPPEAVAA